MADEKELFLGSVPRGTSKELLHEFLNEAMRRAKLVTSDHTAIVAVRMPHTDCAFLDCASKEDAEKALYLNGIPLFGGGWRLRVLRPKAYCGPLVRSIPNAFSFASCKELIVENLHVHLTQYSSTVLSNFIQTAMEQTGFTVSSSSSSFNTNCKSPIVWIRPERKEHTVRVLFRSKEEADHVFLKLNHIPFMGRYLWFKRPPEYTGPPEEELPRDTWQDTVTKLVLWNDQQRRMPSRVLVLGNILPLDCTAMDDIIQDIQAQCEMFGTIHRMELPKNGKGEIFVQYSSKEEAYNAILEFTRLTFDGKMVTATFFDELKFANNDF